MALSATMTLLCCTSTLEAQIEIREADSAAVDAMNQALSRLYAWQLGEYENTGRYSVAASALIDSFTPGGVRLEMLSFSDSGWVALARHELSTTACIEVAGVVPGVTNGVFDPNRCARYIPRDLDEAVGELRRWISPSQQRRHARLSEQIFLDTEGLRGLGRAVRELWHLSSVNRLTVHFRTCGTLQAEDMSQAILRKYHREITAPNATPAQESSQLDGGWRASPTHALRAP